MSCGVAPSLRGGTPWGVLRSVGDLALARDWSGSSGMLRWGVCMCVFKDVWIHLFERPSYKGRDRRSVETEIASADLLPQTATTARAGRLKAEAQSSVRVSHV